MGLPVFHGRRPVMIGDDRGDEPALRAAQRLGGIGLKVAGEHFGNGAEFAGPANVRAWLSELGADQRRAARS
jgi:trehalose 6-phosphate phosphatase